VHDVLSWVNRTGFFSRLAASCAPQLGDSTAQQPMWQASALTCRWTSSQQLPFWKPGDDASSSVNTYTSPPAPSPAPSPVPLAREPTAAGSEPGGSLTTP
jgi:hypothetical protein